MTKAIGIDLGTTNSVACYFDGHTPRVLLNAHYLELTPSVVSYQPGDDSEPGEFLVGKDAVSQAKLYPENTIYSIKRLMGRPYNNEHIQHWQKQVPFAIVESTEPIKGLATVMMGGRQYLPEDISAMILKEIKRYSETALGDEVTHAVITVPAYFGEPERAATREAGKKAGLIVKTLLPEPTAAALAFGKQPQSEEGNTILVFDLGGGTFDISIISLVAKDYNVLVVHGDRFLGGDDFDSEIVKMILKYVQEKHGIDLSQDNRFRVIAKTEAEAAKKSLSNLANESVSIVVPEAVRVGDKPINLKLKITREEFEGRIRPLVQRCKDLVNEAMAKESLTKELISDVLLVGGSTAVPLVYQAMRDVFGESKIRRNVNPMHCVAIGAGILAHHMKGIECPKCQKVCDESQSECPVCRESLAVARSVLEEIEVTDITTNHFGIQAVSGSDPHAFKALVEKGQRLPMTDPKRKTFYTTEEGQSLIRLPVYEGLGTSVLQNSQIGVIEYPLPTGLPVNTPIHVEFLLDRQSIVTVNIEVEGFGLRYGESLKRELSDRVEETPEEEPLIDDDEEEMDEQEKHLAILDIFIERARNFTANYEPILTQTQQKRLGKAIEEAREVLDNDKADAAMDAIRKLDKLMASCGTASLIDQAHLVANAADAETAQKMNQAADELKVHAEHHNTVMEQKLSPIIAAMIRQVHQKQQGIEKIGTAKTYGGLLGDRAPARDVARPLRTRAPARDVARPLRTRAPARDVARPPVPAPSPRQRHSHPEVPGQAVDQVHFSVTSPPAVRPGRCFVLDIWAHLEAQREIVIERARQALGGGEIQIQSKGPLRVERGTVLTVRVQIEGLILEDPEDTILWEGTVGNAQFPVRVPSDAARGHRSGLATIYVDGLRLAKLHFTLLVHDEARADVQSLPIEAARHRKAFASYASSDRDQVLPRLQGIQKAAPSLDIFLDVLSLRSGQRWEEELWKVIPLSDVFYLFWSAHAKASEWVEKEWRCALTTRGIDFIDPVPLVPPEEAPPPLELAGKHFNDWVLAFTRSQARKTS